MDAPIIPTTVTFFREPEKIDQAIIDVFGPGRHSQMIVYDTNIIKVEPPDTVVFTDPEIARTFCKKMNELRNIIPRPPQRFPLMFGDESKWRTVHDYNY